MNETEWLNAAQDRGLISDNCVTIDDTADVDIVRAVEVIGKIERKNYGKATPVC